MLDFCEGGITASWDYLLPSQDGDQYVDMERLLRSA